MQSVLSPIVGRLSDVLDRKYLAAIPPLIAFAGAVISAKASSMSMLIGGGILIGTTLSTISIVQAIPSEILPLKYRALANGFAFLGGAIGGLYVHLPESKIFFINSRQNWFTRFWCSDKQQRRRLAIHFLDASSIPWSNIIGLIPLLLASPSRRIPEIFIPTIVMGV
jgi:MFS family permease